MKLKLSSEYVQREIDGGPIIHCQRCNCNLVDVVKTGQHFTKTVEQVMQCRYCKTEFRVRWHPSEPNKRVVMETHIPDKLRTLKDCTQQRLQFDTDATG